MRHSCPALIRTGGSVSGLKRADKRCFLPEIDNAPSTKIRSG